jgi:hypothetical protein
MQLRGAQAQMIAAAFVAVRSKTGHFRQVTSPEVV